MKKNFKIFLLLFLSVCFLAISIFYVNAAKTDTLEITNYPSIPGLKTPTVNSDLSAFVAYYVGLIIYITGIVAIISFAVGAVQFSMFAVSPEGAKNGKDRMKGAVLGLLLSVSAYTILNTINSNIIYTEVNPLEATDGVYLSNGSKYLSSPNSEANISADVTSGYNTLIYKCTSGPKLLVWKYANTNFDYTGNVDTKEISCGGNYDIGDSGSFKWAYETAGIYYYLGSNCSGYMDGPHTTSEELSDPFRANIKSIKIINDVSNKTYYGAVFHNTSDKRYGGACTTWLTTNKESDCQNVDITAFSDDIFVWNYNSTATSGDGVEFYAKAYGWNTDSQSGGYKVAGSTMPNYWQGNPAKINYVYTNVTSTDAKLCNGSYPSCSAGTSTSSYNSSSSSSADSSSCCPCLTLEDCLGSIRISGNYLVYLQSKGVDENGKKINYCKTSTSNTENLQTYNYIQVSSGNKLEKITIIPIK